MLSIIKKPINLVSNLYKYTTNNTRYTTTEIRLPKNMALNFLAACSTTIIGLVIHKNVKEGNIA